MSHVSASAAFDKSGFLASGRLAAGRFSDTASARQWLDDRRRTQRCAISPIRFSDLRGWQFEDATGDLVHQSGHFFRVQGIRARCDFPAFAHALRRDEPGSEQALRQGEPELLQFEQPMINQPEVGVLGILARRFDGVLHFLLQAKMEPGNLNLVQLSPTVQATRSNYTRVHGGARPLYLEYFLSRTSHRVLVDQLQSEQGLFFLRKRNRNIIVETDAEVPLHEDFHWLTLGQIKQLTREPHTVNMDTRTVVAAIPLVSSPAEAEALGPGAVGDGFGEALVASTLAERGYQRTDALLSWLTEIRARAEVDVQPCALNSIQGWARDEHTLRRHDDGYFRVLAVAVESDSREVASWTQPMVQPAAPGISAFVTRRIDGMLHFLVQARMEPGVWNLIELGPTVQSLPGAPMDERGTPFLLREVLDGTAGAVRHRSTQSEEGGRFYQYATEHIVVELDAHDERPIPPNYTWATLGQINALIRYGNHLNIEARSVLACLDVRQ